MEKDICNIFVMGESHGGATNNSINFFFLIKKIDFIDSELNLHSSVLLIQGGDSSTILHFVLPEI